MKSLRSAWLNRIAAVALTIFIAAACDDDEGTLSPEDFDFAQTQATVDEVVQKFFTGNEGAQSLSGSGELIGAAIGSASSVILAMPQPNRARLVRTASELQARVNELQSAGRLAAIPDAILGTTFIFDPAANQGSGGYVPSERTGAPTNGVRFILYEVNDNGDIIVDPLTEIGHVDIIDNTSFTTEEVNIDVSLEALVNDVAVVDYTVTGTITATSGNLSLSGTLSDGTETLDFQFDIAGQDFENDAVGDFVMVFQGLTLTFNIDLNPDGESVAASLSDGANTIVFQLNLSDTGDILAGSTVRFNGQTVAVISGNVDTGAVDVTNAEGGPLSPDQIADLEALFVGLNAAAELTFGLFGLGLFLVLVSIVG